jgi:GTPase SAR1 family protein
MIWLYYTGFGVSAILIVFLGAATVRARRRSAVAHQALHNAQHDYDKEFRDHHSKRISLEQACHHLQHELNHVRTELKRLQDVLRTYTWHGPPLHCDLFVLGPKNSGKSSITLKWKKPWTDIRTISPTSSWNEYQLALDDQLSTVKTTRRHADFGLELTHESRLHILVRDYAGEDGMRFSAMKHLAATTRVAILLFVMRVQYADGRILRGDEHAQYYSDVFVDAIRHELARLNKSLAKIIVVYNGIDELPREWDHSRRLKEITAANERALAQINRAFASSVEHVPTSALTDEGLITLLGRVVTIAIGGPPERTMVT